MCRFNMNVLFDNLFNKGIYSYLLVMLTMFIWYILFIAGIRLIIQETIPSSFDKCLKSYISVVKACEVVKARFINNQNESD